MSLQTSFSEKILLVRLMFNHFAEIPKKPKPQVIEKPNEEPTVVEESQSPEIKLNPDLQLQQMDYEFTEEYKQKLEASK